MIGLFALFGLIYLYLYFRKMTKSYWRFIDQNTNNLERNFAIFMNFLTFFMLIISLLGEIFIKYDYLHIKAAVDKDKVKCENGIQLFKIIGVYCKPLTSYTIFLELSARFWCFTDVNKERSRLSMFD